MAVRQRPGVNLRRSPAADREKSGQCGDSSSQIRFRTLALAALEKQQAERARMARTLHDEIAQVLSGAGLQLDILRMDLEDRVPEIAERTAEIQALLERVVGQVRELSYELNPDIVERAGLQPALDLLMGRFRKSFPGVLRLTYDSSARVPAVAGAAMEKIAAEAMANAIRHARCRQIEIVVKPTREGVELLVRDDGSGFDHREALASARGLGLLMMEYSAKQAGLRFAVDGMAGQGSTVQVLAPKR